MDKLVKDLPAEGKILWRVGTPQNTEFILCYAMIQKAYAYTTMCGSKARGNGKANIIT